MTPSLSSRRWRRAALTMSKYEEGRQSQLAGHARDTRQAAHGGACRRRLLLTIGILNYVLRAFFGCRSIVREAHSCKQQAGTGFQRVRIQRVLSKCDFFDQNRPPSRGGTEPASGPHALRKIFGPGRHGHAVLYRRPAHALPIHLQTGKWYLGREQKITSPVALVILTAQLASRRHLSKRGRVGYDCRRFVSFLE